jgi:hypothetical protein
MNTTEEDIEEHNRYVANIDAYCNNCGRKHDGRLIETMTDGDNNTIEIVVCNGPVYSNKTVSEYERMRAQMIVDNPGIDLDEENT